MTDIWMDVDAALSEVPVNKVALIDDTDFKTREESVVYNQAGLDLVWNFVTTSGAYTQTAVTPTTAGDYDWVNQGNGMYSIEIPASGGASINNDTEGFGWFTGYATGILPWTGPIIGFRAAALNNALIDGGDVLDVNLTEIGGVAQSATDLKDFADEGYDPATNKVQGVVLADTVTDVTNLHASAATAAAQTTAQNDLDIITGTDGVTLATAQALYAPSKAGDAMTLTAGERTAIVDEWETQSQADPTGFHVNLKEIDGNANIMQKLKEYVDANVLFSDTAQAGGASTITLAAGTSIADNDLKDYAIYLNGGTGAGQFARIDSVVAATQVATINTPINGWATVPDATTTYVILSAGAILHISSLHAAALTEITNELDANSTLADWVDGGRLDLLLDDIPNTSEFEARTPTAAQLAYIVSNAADGLPVTFTGGTTTTAILGNVDGSAASSTNDVYNGRILVFNSGTLNQQVTDITDYDGATKTATITAVTTAVTSSHTANMK